MSYFAGLLVGTLSQNSLPFLFSRLNPKCMWPVKFSGATEILADFEAIDEDKILNS